MKNAKKSRDVAPPRLSISKIIEEMYIEYDVKQDGLYLRGHEEGEKKSLKKVVIRCLEEGDSYEKIARITKLDIKAIAKIDEERKKK